MSTEVQQQIQQQIQGLEAQLSQAKQVVAQRDMAQKLAKNAEFRKLILEEFCVHECARYAQGSADPAISAENRADSLAIAQAAGHLRRWLSVKIQMGNVAEREISEVEAALEEARAEEDVQQ
ncbi:hypothetical protein SB861_37745 [Paraburkholderia sp. SIMBA_049]